MVNAKMSKLTRRVQQAYEGPGMAGDTLCVTWNIFKDSEKTIRTCARI